METNNQRPVISEMLQMKAAIETNLNHPKQLEKLYRENKTTFKSVFNNMYAEIQESETAQIWHERLNFENEEISWGTRKELTFVIVASFVAALIAQIPEFASIKPEDFFPRNIAFIVFPVLTAYFIWKQQLPAKRIIIASIVFLLSAIYINVLPDNTKSDTIILACIHLPIFLWALLGSAFAGENINNYQRRLEFLKYNGDLVVMTTLMLIAGGLLTGITLGMFELIEIKIEEFYFKYIVISGLAAAPIIGTYLVQTNPQLVNKVSPVIAKVFTPLVLITMIVYLIAIIYSGKDPYNDRDFLMIFNLLLIGVMAIILFSISEITKGVNNSIGLYLLFGLSAVTIIVNGIALSAILFRISEWGITPNRLAVLGANMLMLTNLLMVTFRLFKSLKNRNELLNVEKSIAVFLPVYGLWTMLVTFTFPILFGFK